MVTSALAQDKRKTGEMGASPGPSPLCSPSTGYRPKSGFDVPLGTWLRGPLRDWAGSMLDSSRLRQEGYFHSDPIQQKWREHLSGRREWEGQLWIILMFQAWLEETTKSTFASPRTLAASAQASRSAFN